MRGVGLGMWGIERMVCVCIDGMAAWSLKVYHCIEIVKIEG